MQRPKLDARCDAYLYLNLNSNRSRVPSGDLDLTFGTQVKKAVVSVPAYFDERQREATMDAGRKLASP